ncbi:MAG: nuclear transport factor 2 family protein [Beijerinckiaceae bacterium]
MSTPNVHTHGEIMTGIQAAAHAVTAPQTLDALRALNRRFIHNYVTNDVASHDALLHPRFAYLAGDGRRVARAPYLAAWATGFDPDEIIYWDLRGEEISVIGPVALVRAANKYTVRKDGHAVTEVASYIDTYLHENGQWLCIQAQITPTSPVHWPSDDSIVVRYVRGVLQADR